jgi:four helix bundle protein
MTYCSKNFRTLDLAKRFYQDCKQVLAERYVQDQLLRASLSVVLNLAEGTAKPSPKERARFYSISLASFRECQALPEIKEQQELLKQYDVLGVCLHRLQKHTREPQQKDSPQTPRARTP